MNYSEIISGLTTFFSTHLQVNTVVVGSEFDLNAVDDTQFVAVLIDPSSGQKNGVLIEFSFKIVIADKMLTSDTSMATSIQNAAIAIANDMTNYIESDFADGIIDYSVSSYDTFDDRYDSNTAGIVFNLKVSTDNTSNTCLSMNPIITGNNGTGDASLISVQSTDEINMQMTGGLITATINESALSYTKQVVSQTMVVIGHLEHNLETVSSVAIYDTGGNVVIGRVNVTSEKDVVVQFQIPLTGRIVLSV